MSVDGVALVHSSGVICKSRAGGFALYPAQRAWEEAPTSAAGAGVARVRSCIMKLCYV